MSSFETNISKPGIKVVSLSDIHGDIQSFIIALRDCAKVIRKKDPQPPQLPQPPRDHLKIELKTYIPFTAGTILNDTIYIKKK